MLGLGRLEQGARNLSDCEEVGKCDGNIGRRNIASWLMRGQVGNTPGTVALNKQCTSTSRWHPGDGSASASRKEQLLFVCANATYLAARIRKSAIPLQTATCFKGKK